MRCSALFPSLLLLLTLSACVARSDNVNQRFDGWQQIVDAIPLGSSKADIQTWAAQNGLQRTGTGAPIGNKPPMNHLTYEAETVPVHGLLPICASWDILIDFAFDANDRLTSRKITELGACL